MKGTKMKGLNLTVFTWLLTGLVTAHAFPVQQIREQAQSLHARGLTPVGVFDLDETLIHSYQRKIASYLDVITSDPKFSAWPAEKAVATSALRMHGEAVMLALPNEYDAHAFFWRLGIYNVDFVNAVDTLSLPIYLSGKYMNLDTANRGAVSLLQGLYQAGGRVYFVTSRFESTQRDATMESLRKLHLYREGQSMLIARGNAETSVQFKQRALQQIRNGLQAGDRAMIVAENEPENLNLMMATFPEATPVFVTGAILNTQVSLNSRSNLILTHTFAESGD